MFYVEVGIDGYGGEGTTPLVGTYEGILGAKYGIVGFSIDLGDGLATSLLVEVEQTQLAVLSLGVLG